MRQRLALAGDLDTGELQVLPTLGRRDGKSVAGRVSLTGRSLFLPSSIDLQADAAGVTTKLSAAPRACHADEP